MWSWVGVSERGRQTKKSREGSHLNSLLLSQALFLLISRIVSIFSKFCGSPMCREESFSSNQEKSLSPLQLKENFTSACFGCHQLWRRLWYRVHDKSIKFTAQDTRDLVIEFFSFLICYTTDTIKICLCSDWERIHNWRRKTWWKFYWKHRSRWTL